MRGEADAHRATQTCNEVASDELENLINDDDWERQVEDGLPLRGVSKSTGGQAAQ